MTEFLASLLLRLSAMGAYGQVLFVGLYVASAVTLAPAFLLTVAAGAVWGVWVGSLLVFVGAVLGASTAYAIARKLSGTRWLAWLDRDPRVSAVRQAVDREGAWVQFLLRLSPVVPFNLLNYALGLMRVGYHDFAVALLGMIPAILMYTYWGKVVGDVTLLAAGYAPPRGPEYYALLVAGLLATAVASALIARTARRAIEEQRRGGAAGHP